MDSFHVSLQVISVSKRLLANFTFNFCLPTVYLHVEVEIILFDKSLSTNAALMRLLGNLLLCVAFFRVSSFMCFLLVHSVDMNTKIYLYLKQGLTFCNCMILDRKIVVLAENIRKLNLQFDQVTPKNGVLKIGKYKNIE